MILLHSFQATIEQGLCRYGTMSKLLWDSVQTAMGHWTVFKLLFSSAQAVMGQYPKMLGTVSTGQLCKSCVEIVMGQCPNCYAIVAML